MKRKDIKEIQKNDHFYCRRENGKEYFGTVQTVKVMKNRETMVTIAWYEHRDHLDAGHNYRNIYPCDCVEWSAETPELV